VPGAHNEALALLAWSINLWNRNNSFLPLPPLPRRAKISHEMQDCLRRVRGRVPDGVLFALGISTREHTTRNRNSYLFGRRKIAYSMKAPGLLSREAGFTSFRLGKGLELNYVVSRIIILVAAAMPA